MRRVKWRTPPAKHRPAAAAPARRTTFDLLVAAGVTVRTDCAGIECSVTAGERAGHGGAAAAPDWRVDAASGAHVIRHVIGMLLRGSIATSLRLGMGTFSVSSGRLAT